MKKCYIIVFAIILTLGLDNISFCEENSRIPVDESTPSKSMYFDWININWYGGNENKVINNLLFFKWLHDEYGLELDIYLMDAGNIDNGPVCNGCEKQLRDAPRYGGIDSRWFLEKYPAGLEPIVSLAESFGCQIGLWMGPDGYGENDSTAHKRIEMLEFLTRQYNIALFKLDACCSDLKPENEKYFIQAMQTCYANNPELIVLNHRINLTDAAKQYTSTFLWEGKETYIDVSAFNTTPAPHHRYTLERGLPPELKRLTEDHGVCLSSFLDYWEDDLVLQAFNRNLILSPEIYGNPWLLNDEEFGLLARLFNLHRKYNAILVNGMVLPEEQYGQYAVSRGDEKTRFLTFRNLSWEPQRITVDINASIGLAEAENFEVREHHPYERIVGSYKFNDRIEIEVLPFRSSLIKISSDAPEAGVQGCCYQIVKDMKNHLEINLLGFPGEEKRVELTGIHKDFTSVQLDDRNVSELLDDVPIEIRFSGEKTEADYHQYLGELTETSVPDKSIPYFETMYFSASNNCLEIQSLFRSGGTHFEAVKNARKAFFEDDVFIQIGAWDKFALDQDEHTAFKVREYCDWVKPGLLRAHFQKSSAIDEIHLSGLEAGYQPEYIRFSDDLENWTDAQAAMKNNALTISIPSGNPVEFLKVKPTPLQLSELKAYKNGQLIDVHSTTISNLFPESDQQIKQAFANTFQIQKTYQNSILAVAIEGDYGRDGAIAVIETNGQMIGPFDRSPAFEYNNWEHLNNQHTGNYTYYFRLPGSDKKLDLTVTVLGVDKEITVKPRAWLTTYPIPFAKKRLILK